MNTSQNNNVTGQSQDKQIFLENKKNKDKNYHRKWKPYKFLSYEDKQKMSKNEELRSSTYQVL